MFTPENIKKLTNVSIVSLKTKKEKFELALFPNKFYEYQHNLETDLTKILHTPIIFKDVSKGQLANKDTIKAEFPNKDQDTIIKHILDYGVEKKSEKTRNYEMQRREREIAVLLSKKMLFNGKNISVERVLEFMREKGISVCQRKDVKVQANEMMKRMMEDERFDVKKMRVLLTEEGRVMEMTGDEFVKFKEESGNRGYIVLQDECVIEEEIC